MHTIRYSFIFNKTKTLHIISYYFHHHHHVESISNISRGNRIQTGTFIFLVESKFFRIAFIMYIIWDGRRRFLEKSDRHKHKTHSIATMKNILFSIFRIINDVMVILFWMDGWTYSFGWFRFRKLFVLLCRLFVSV